MTQNTSVGYIPASKTASDLTLYVYEDATGTGDGSSKANGFTTLQAAIDAIPDVAQNVTVIVCKGSTNYLGQTTTIQKASVKSLTIRGEFYAYESCDANAVAGKVVDASADFSDFEVGDRVVCTKYSGIVGESSIDDYFYATITEVGEGYVQTSESTKVPTTGWRYLINQTQITSVNDIVAGGFVDIRCNFNICIVGISFTVSGNSGNGRCAIVSRKGYLLLRYCMFDGNQGILITHDITVTVSDNYLNVSYAGVQIAHGAHGDICRNVVIGTPPACFSIHGGSNPTIKYGYISTSYATGCAIYTDSPIDNAYVDRSYIDSSCTYGAYGYNITLVNCTNNAATPVYNLTSGGSIEEWDGQALPSIDDATGGQVLALKSDKSGIEFATVSAIVDIHGEDSTSEFSTGDEVLIYDSNLGENRKILRGNFFNGLEGDYISIHGTFEETTPATNMELLVYDPSVPANRRMTRANFLDGISAVGAFTDLTDTPASYEGYDETYYVRVNAVSNALEFATVPSSYTLPVATDSILGGIKIGSRLTITDGVLSADEQGSSYTLPTASADTLGGVKIGSGITITDGVISAASGGGDITGPASTTENKIPQWDSTNKKLKDGLAIGTTSGTIAAGDDSRFTNDRTPTAHNLIDTTGHPVSGLTTGHFLKATGATTYGFGAHGLTASDVGAATTSTKLDDFGTPDDNTDLNASTDRHGLLPKLGGGTTNFLRADGTWAEPAGGGAGGYSTLVQRSLEGVVYETTLMYWVAPATCTINSVSMALSSNPSATGSYCKVQVMKNGILETNSIFTADTPMQITESTSASNGIYTASGTLDSNQTTLATGDVIQFRVNQADTGSADLLIQMKVTFT